MLTIIIGSACHNIQRSEVESTAPIINTIAFGSCSHQDNPEQLWTEITKAQPDLLILGGDNIYGDTHDMTLMKARYDKQKSRPEYQNLLNTVPVIGIWDDHDYGMNDGGKHFSKKDSSKWLMLDFLDVPADNPVWRREGAYNAYSYGPKNKKIKVILLDTRYFRDTLSADTLTSARYLPNKDGDLLGEKQWQWLEYELTDSDADMHILVSGIQVIAAQHDFEKWSNFPQSRERLFKLLVKTHPANTLILSGDRHIAEISKIDLEGLPYPLYDLTSSGLTHTWSEVWPEENKYRVGEMVIKRNYGLVQINWQQSSPGIVFQVKGHNDSTFLEHHISFDKAHAEAN
ncbi:alkaline phosphatase D family protein [Fulvivirga imtechensis]|uniref:alkaline phosphatase D family protein n=1 Tax=Fulvivirga imtechensis TaxID=881893 RepID=UPI001FE00ABD|nr:alkaline phosphatase D family protein [Fulvivirga imtechensis]